MIAITTNNSIKVNPEFPDVSLPRFSGGRIFPAVLLFLLLLFIVIFAGETAVSPTSPSKLLDTNAIKLLSLGCRIGVKRGCSGHIEIWASDSTG